MKHFISAFENYANFSGRASISQYWTFFIISFLIGLIPGINIIYILASIIPSLSIYVRRLHDTGHSGAYIFLILIPIIGWIWLLILLLKEGDINSNKYGMPSSSSNSSTNSKHEEVMGYDFTTKTEHKSSSKAKENNNTSNVAQIDGDASSNDISQLNEIEKIKRQYEKGIFTEQEKNDLINKILNEDEALFTNREIEKIKSNYKQILDPYRDKFLEIYSIEYVELEDLHNQGIIDEKMLISKLEILKINIAKRIQKEIRFKSIKGFEVYQGLIVKNGNEVGAIVEVINSKEIRVQLNWDNSLSQVWLISDINPTGKVKKNIKDWDLYKNNFLLLNDIDYFGLPKLKVGDIYKEGEVFFVSNEEVKIFLIFDKLLSAKPIGFEQNTFIQCDYKTLKSKEDNFWKIPDVESVKKCLKYLIDKGKFVPMFPQLIWTSEMLDNSTIKCVQLFHNHNYDEPTTIMCSKQKHQYGILVHTIKI